MSEPSPSTSRNLPCPCGSGERFKHCHGRGDEAGASGRSPPSTTSDELVREGLNAHQRGDLMRAGECYRQALLAAPAHPHAQHFLGVLHYQRGDLAAALPLLRCAVDALPGEPEFHNNLGLVLAAGNDEASAIDVYRRALALKPDHAAAWNNLGLVLISLNRVPEAIEAFGRATGIAPAFAHAHWNLSLAQLVSGDFERGWVEYEWRLALPELHRDSSPRTLARWDGHAPVNRLLVEAEQGIGDAVQFVRFAPLLRRRCARLVLRCSAALAPLFENTPGIDCVVAAEEPPPEHDAYLPLLSAARILGTSLHSIPTGIPYITAAPASAPRADAARTQGAAVQVEAASPAGAASPVGKALHVGPVTQAAAPLRVGLAWSGNRAHANDRNRSFALSTLDPLIELPGIRWHSLQPGGAQNELASQSAYSAIEVLPPGSPLVDTAALIDELDLVITVDTAVAHIAGALGRPVWILLPYAPDWRWLLDREDSPWYPSARLFRQSQLRDWAGVIARVRTALQKILATNSHSRRRGAEPT